MHATGLRKKLPRSKKAAKTLNKCDVAFCTVRKIVQAIHYLNVYT